MTTPTITVKPLVWRLAGGDDGDPLPISWPVWHGSFGGHVMGIVVKSGLDRYTVAFPHSDHSTLESAQAAVQSEWDRFIRAAVEADPPITNLVSSYPFVGRTDRPAPADGLHVGCRVVLKSGYGEYFAGGERGNVTALDNGWVEVDCLPGVRFSRSYATLLPSANP